LISEGTLRSFFEPFGDIHYVKVPVGKHCGFVQFVRKADAEKAIEKLQGYPIGGSRIRLSWGRSQCMSFLFLRFHSLFLMTLLDKAAQAAAQAAQAAVLQAQYTASAYPSTHPHSLPNQPASITGAPGHSHQPSLSHSLNGVGIGASLDSGDAMTEQQAINILTKMGYTWPNGTGKSAIQQLLDHFESPPPESYVQAHVAYHSGQDLVQGFGSNPSLPSVNGAKAGPVPMPVSSRGVGVGEPSEEVHQSLGLGGLGWPHTHNAHHAHPHTQAPPQVEPTSFYSARYEPSPARLDLARDMSLRSASLAAGDEDYSTPIGYHSQNQAQNQSHRVGGGGGVVVNGGHRGSIGSSFSPFSPDPNLYTTGNGPRSGPGSGYPAGVVGVEPLVYKAHAAHPSYGNGQRTSPPHAHAASARPVPISRPRSGHMGDDLHDLNGTFASLNIDSGDVIGSGSGSLSGRSSWGSLNMKGGEGVKVVGSPGR
jgi:hypothetical protein